MTRVLIRTPSRDREIGTWIAEKVDVEYDEGNVCFGVEQDSKLIGGAMFNDYNGSNICLHQRMDSPYGMTKQLLRAVFEYAFVYLKVRRVTGVVLGKNQKAIDLNKKLGFEVEGVLRKYFLDDEGGDVVHMVMWPENCRFLGERYGC